MHHDNSQRAVEFGGRSSRPDRATYPVVLSVSALLLLFAGRQPQRAQATPRDVERKLAQHLVKFDNNGAPLIPTLLQLAAVYSLPMGIEKVTPKALNRPIRVRLRGGDVADVLTLAVRQVPDYAWAVEDGAIDIFGKRERSRSSNLLNFVLPSFEVHDQTLNATSNELRTTLVLEVLKPPGVGGDYLGSPELERKRISFALRKATVRQLLNTMVALDEGAVWVARVRPSCLGRLPEAGLWLVLPHAVQDPSDLVDLSPCSSP
jgi:hypothetical protein